MDWNDGDVFQSTHSPTVQVLIPNLFWWKDRQEFSEWREKVACATAVMELYVNLAPFPALKQAPDFSLTACSTFMQ